jgi:CBS domain-containing protein
VKAKDVMTSPVVSVEVDATVIKAAELMLRNRISGLPVTDDGGRLVGMVTEGDFLRRVETGTQRLRPRWVDSLLDLAGSRMSTHTRTVAKLRM